MTGTAVYGTVVWEDGGSKYAAYPLLPPLTNMVLNWRLFGDPGKIVAHLKDKLLFMEERCNGNIPHSSACREAGC